MSITLARPYAKAVFEVALSEKRLSDWSFDLSALAFAVSLPEAIAFIGNPASQPAEQAALLQAVVAKHKHESLNNLIALLAEVKRLPLLPEVAALFEAYRAEHEKRLAVEVRTFVELTEAQKEALSRSLSERLQRAVTLEIKQDSSLLGGALIQAGDLVIDGSVRGKLNKLRAELVA